MNKGFILLGCFLFAALPLLAQKDYKVVFDFTTKDSLDQKSLIRWLNEVSKNPEAQMEVVMYGQGTALVVKGKSLVAEDITRLAADKRVSFKVCSSGIFGDQSVTFFIFVLSQTSSSTSIGLYNCWSGSTWICFSEKDSSFPKISEI